MLGHTHELPDQFFSVVAKKLDSDLGRCVLTPLGLLEFIKTVITDPYKGYLVYDVKILEYMYDFSSAIKPYINNKIKGHTVIIYFYLNRSNVLQSLIYNLML